MKKFAMLMLSAVMMLSLLSGCGQEASSTATSESAQPSSASQQEEAAVDPIVIKYSTSESSTSILAEVMTEVIAEIQEKSNGAIQFETYYSNELGSLADVTEQMTLGGNMMANASGDFYATYGCPDILSSALFYAIPDQAALQKLNESELFASWCDQIEEASGLKILCCNWAAAPRNIISTRPINSVEDIQGLKIRVPGTAADAFFSELGASTMSMPFSEVYTNLDSGMIEAAEAALGGLYDYGLYEVAKYVYLSEHSLAPACIAVSESVWNQLTVEQQTLLQETMTKYGDVYTQRSMDTDTDYRAKMEEEGVTFVEPSPADIEVMKAAGAESFKAFPELSEGLAEKLAETIS